MLETLENFSSESSPMTCLVVDDSAFMRFHLKRLIRSFQNITPSEATNGDEAIKEYARLHPDFVLMDIIMPGMQGVETVRRIRALDPAARVIMISSVAYKEMVEEAFDAGAKYFIPKPVTTEALRKAIESVLTFAA
jgi:two-component system, chemotaxis family, chemotaxis protein CheY